MVKTREKQRGDSAREVNWYLLQRKSIEASCRKRKFGGGRQPTGTPSLAWSCVVVVFSLLAGASVVHNIYKPNLTLPPVDEVDRTKQKLDKKE
ncbi:hypothetical protein E2542_SST07701 [Spatholobus suberectus]|nr:hypothetical protein E2542_SST07701 [Spatholobus suberectus]